MRNRIFLLLLIMLTGLVADNAQAQGQHKAFLPLFRQDPPPATFDLRVMRVGNGRSGLAGCVSPMVPVAASQGDICPLPGDYISLVADNPSSIALGGRQGDGSDAAWEGEPAEFDLVAPAQVIADADVVEISGVTGYVENAGLFTAPTDNYSVIVIRYQEGTAQAAQGYPSVQEMVDFQQIMSKIIQGGTHFDLDLPGNVRFYDRNYSGSKTMVDCFVTHGIWSPAAGQIKFIGGSPFVILIGGDFDDEPLAQCMGLHRWIKAAELMTLPAAANLRMAVDARRGGPITPFQWVTDSAGTIYAVVTVATGTVAYYGVKAINSLTPSPALFLFVPNDILNCVTVAGVKTCTVTEGEPGQ